MRKTVKTIMRSFRLPFILLAVVCVALGCAAARHFGTAFHVLHAGLACLGAVAAHASVNMLNEWHDFKSGLDATTTRTPFSGGSGGLQENPPAAPAVLAGGLLAACMVMGIGLFFLARGLWAVVPIGIAGVLLILLYTPIITRHPLICLFAPGIAFGPLVVAGTAYVVSGEMRLSYWLLSLPVLFLVNNLLLLNQFPDLEADRRAGRKTYPVVAGTARAARVFTGFNILAFAALLALILGGILPRPLAWLAALPLLAAIPSHRKAALFTGSPDQLMPALRNNVLTALAVPAILAAILACSK